MTLSQNIITSYEGPLGAIAFQDYHNFTCYRLDRVISAHEARVPSNKNNLLKTKFYLSNQRTVVIRKLFDLLMLMSEFGGFVKLVVIFGYLLANPINRFIYIMIMAKRLYFAKTKREDVFLRENDKKSVNVNHRLSRYTKQDRIP